MVAGGLCCEYEEASETVRVSPRCAVALSLSLSRPLDPANRHFITTEMRGQVATQRSPVVALPPRWHPPHYPAEGMLGNWNGAKWAAVQHVRLSMGFHYPKQKQRVTLNNRFPSVSPQSNDSTLSLTWTWFSTIMLLCYCSRNVFESHNGFIKVMCSSECFSICIRYDLNGLWNLIVCCWCWGWKHLLNVLLLTSSLTKISGIWAVFPKSIVSWS